MNYFPENLGKVNKEKEEHFRQDMEEKKRRRNPGKATLLTLIKYPRNLGIDSFSRIHPHKILIYVSIERRDTTELYFVSSSMFLQILIHFIPKS